MKLLPKMEERTLVFRACSGVEVERAMDVLGVTHHAVADALAWSDSRMSRFLSREVIGDRPGDQDLLDEILAVEL
jgi:ParB-like chromosome segregation protein Spo0J|tara:strand:+ start:133 stop:357 length:225 start_codon:yes stop_codon:yes gene_type:complete